ncbi:MAG: hypothetical protein ACI8PZ_003042 [Myxococcota bacterium]|jgi:hypothetical protein
MVRMWLAAFTVTAMVACGGKDEAADSGAGSTPPITATGGTTPAGTGTGTGGTGVSHARDIQPFWDDKCTPCHIITSSGNLSLKDGHTAQVGVPSTQAVGLNLIEAGSPDDSYTWHKLNDTHESVGGIGGVMPQISRLSSDELDLIETWIVEGAQP